MATTAFIPSSDSDKVIWLNNFSTKIGTYATSVNISAAEVTAVHNDAAMFSYMMNLVEVYKQTLQNITGYKNLLKHAVAQQHLGTIPVLPTLSAAPTTVSEGVFDRVSKLAARINASVNYTDNMGQDLGIVAPASTFRIDQMQPNLTVKLDAGRPHLKCTKGEADAIDLYVDRKDNNGFVIIGRLIKPDYIDTTNVPAATPIVEWDYKAQYVIGNDNVGLMSSVVSVIVKKM